MTVETLWNVPMSIRPLPGPEPLDGIREPVRTGQEPVAVLEDQLAQRRQPDGPWPAGAVEHGAADGALQGGDLLTHRRLGVAEAVRRPAEGPLLGDGGQRPQVSQLDVHRRRG